MKWPNKKDLQNAQLAFGTFKYYEGFNDAIEQCKSLNSAPERLVKLDENELRTIICKHTSEMLDNPDKHGIYPTTKFFNNLIQAIHTLIYGEKEKES